MQKSVSRITFVSALVAASAPPCMAIPVPSGQEPDPADARFDAVCAVGRKNKLTGPGANDWFNANGEFTAFGNGGNAGSGVLVAPSVVLTAKHVLDGRVGGQTLDDFICAPCETCPGSNRWVVRFRRNPDGTVGTMNEDPVPPSTVRGPESFFHVDVVGGLEIDTTDDGFTDAALLFLKEPVAHIEPLPVAGVDFRPFRSLNFGLSDPWGAFGPLSVRRPIHLAGWGSREESQGAQGAGQLRYRANLDLALRTRDYAVHASDFAPAALHDSGSPFLVSDGAGRLVVTGVARSVGPRPGGWIVPGPPGGLFWGDPVGAGLLTSPSRFDVTGSASPASARYGHPDGWVDVPDMLFAAARVADGDPGFDLTGSGDPSSPAYGVPDSVVDLDDLVYFCMEAAGRDDGDTIWAADVLLARDADNDRDGRFTRSDYTAAAATPDAIAKYDFDGDGAIGAVDIELADIVNDSFGHGVRGDVTGDGAVDQDDVDILRMLAETGDIWQDAPSSSPMYLVALDDNLDGHLTELDRAAVGFSILPGEVGVRTNMMASFSSPGDHLPDFDVGRWEHLSVFYALIQRVHSNGSDQLYFDTTGSGDPASPAWGVPDGVVDAKDFKHYLWRRYEVFGPSGSLPDPHVSVRMTPSFDVNGDGRFTFADVKALQTMSPSDPAMALWSFNGGGSPASNAATLFGLCFSRGWNQGVLGDFDGSTVPSCCHSSGICALVFCGVAQDEAPDCDDYFAMHEKINCRGDDLFDGRMFFSDTDTGYRMVLDADLDGDNDAEDRVVVALQGLRVPDVNLDGRADGQDLALFIGLMNAGDPAADIAEPFGEVDVLDLLEFAEWHADGVCGRRGPIPCLADEPLPID